jgi:hypothetical protein
MTNFLKPQRGDILVEMRLPPENGRWIEIQRLEKRITLNRRLGTSAPVYIH